MLAHNSEDIFNADKYPEMVKELKILKEKAAHTPVYFKVEIIVSYLKNRSIKNKWIEANPQLASLMISNSSKTTHIESLFEFYRFKQVPLKNYERYIHNLFFTT